MSSRGLSAQLSLSALGMRAGHQPSERGWRFRAASDLTTAVRELQEIISATSFDQVHDYLDTVPELDWATRIS